MFGLNEALPRSLTQAALPQQASPLACDGASGEAGACDISVGPVIPAALSVCTIDHFYEPLN